VGSPAWLTWEHLAWPSWSPPCQEITEDLGHAPSV
jgi:hypothetical protein